MRNTKLVVAVVVGIVIGLTIRYGLDGTAVAQRPTAGQASAEIVVTGMNAADGGQHVILVDPKLQVIGTYHVDAATGGVSLRSVRNFRWDMMMDEFNAGVPKPNEIRALLEQK